MISRRRFPPSVYASILERQGRECGAVGCHIRLPVPGMAWDHQTPLWAFGADAEDNLQALCPDCHKIKLASPSTTRRSQTSVWASIGVNTGKRTSLEGSMVTASSGRTTTQPTIRKPTVTRSRHGHIPMMRCRYSGSGSVTTTCPPNFRPIT